MSEKKPLILVIDDEESMRDSCSLILAKEGYKTETAPDGESGLKKIKELKLWRKKKGPWKKIL